MDPRVSGFTKKTSSIGETLQYWIQRSKDLNYATDLVEVQQFIATVSTVTNSKARMV